MTNAFGVAVLFILTFLTYAWLSRNLGKAYAKKLARRARLSGELTAAVSSAGALSDENRALSLAFERTTSLYDISKEITKHLEEEKVLSAFVDELSRAITFSDCRFFPDRVDPAFASGHVTPVRLGGKSFGFLAVTGIDEADRDKFDILAGQFALGLKRAILYRKVQEMATFDSLTRVFTRRYWFERCEQEIERSRRFGHKACCLMIDVDHFKDCNDRYGHLVGDALLVETAQVIRENIRQIDFLGKYGGEEFCLLLTETGRENAVYAAERIRQAIEQRSIRAYDEELRVTVSIGIAEFPAVEGGLGALIDAADTALYRAKELGRNRVCGAGRD